MPKDQYRPGKARKVDVITPKEGLVGYLKRVRKWKEAGMEGPKPRRRNG